jgi:hypothetical protein
MSHSTEHVMPPNYMFGVNIKGFCVWISYLGLVSHLVIFDNDFFLKWHITFLGGKTELTQVFWCLKEGQISTNKMTHTTLFTCYWTIIG